MMDHLYDLLAPMAWLISTTVIIVLCFTGIVRPLLKYLQANHEIEHHKKHKDSTSFVSSAPDLLVSQQGDMDGDTAHSTRLASKVMLNRLAAGDPEKAGNLIKKWLNEN